MNLEMIKNVLNINVNTSTEEIVNSIIIYLRKSRKDSDYFKGEPIEMTLKRHEEELQEWCVRVFGISIPESNIFREVVSGDTIEDRPKMQEVLNTIESNKIKAVLCIETERLARGNTIDQGIIAQAFKYSNTKIITPYKIYDLDNEDDLSYFEDGLYQSRKYLIYIKRVLRRGRRRSVEEGKHVASSTPYGYQKKKMINEKGFTLEFNEAERKIVQLVTDLFAYGLNTKYKIKSGDTIGSIAKIYSCKKSELISSNPNSNFLENEIIKIECDMGTSAIATYLNYLNIKPKKAKIWSPNMIRNILYSPTLYGYVTWERRKTITIMKNGELVKTRPRNNSCLMVKGNFEPILNPNDEKTKIIIRKLEEMKTNKVPNIYEIKNPLSGLIICPICHKKMIRRPYNDKNKSDTLYCKTARCITVGSNLSLVEKRLIDSIKEVLNEYNNYVDNYSIEYQKEIENSNNLILIIEEEIKKATSKLERCYDLLEDGTYSKETFTKRVNKIKNDIMILNQKKEENLNINLIQKYEERKKMIPLLKEVISNYEKCDTIKQKNDLLSSIIDYVIYEKTRGGRGYEDKFNLKINLKI